jgi:hypothetical protein
VGHGVWSLRGYCCCRERERETVGGPTPGLALFSPCFLGIYLIIEKRILPPTFGGRPSENPLKENFIFGFFDEKHLVYIKQPSYKTNL